MRAPTGVIAMAVARDLRESGSVRVGDVDVACSPRVGGEDEFPAVGRPAWRVAADAAAAGESLPSGGAGGFRLRG